MFCFYEPVKPGWETRLKLFSTFGNYEAFVLKMVVLLKKARKPTDKQSVKSDNLVRTWASDISKIKNNLRTTEPQIFCKIITLSLGYCQIKTNI